MRGAGRARGSSLALARQKCRRSRHLVASAGRMGTAATFEVRGFRGMGGALVLTGSEVRAGSV